MALAQLLRVDEPTKETTDDTNETTDLGDLTSPKFPTFYTYDIYGKMVKVQQGKTGEPTIQYRYFKYDSLGRLIRVRQPEQEVNSGLNLTDSYNTSGQWTAAFAYDILGNVKRATDANGVNIVNEYDKASRVTKRCYTAPNVSTAATQCSQISGNASTDTPTVEYWYDGKGLASEQSPHNFAKGKLTKVYSSVSETRYTQFDNFGRLKESQQKTPFGNQSVTDATARISKYNYNFSGALSEQIYPSGRSVKNEFESDGDLSKIHGKAQLNAMDRTYASGFTYTPDGRIEKLQLGNGLWESAKFDPARGQVTELALGTSAGDGSVWKLEYKYGELATNGVDVEAAKNTGNIAKQTLSFNGLAQPLVQTFRYDSLYRLKEARETAGTTTAAPQTWKQVFDYDRFGNRTAYQKFVGTNQITLDSTTFPSVNAADNRLNTNQGYSYDKNGNVIVDAQGRQFFFNGDNKQIEVKNASSVLLGKYYYDGEGKRVKKKTYDTYGVEQEETVFVYDGMGKLVAEYSTKPPPTNPTTSFTATDQLGSPRVITNSLGEVTSRRDFQPFGEELSPDTTYRKTTDKYGATDSVRQRFTGYQKDEETGLDFAEARMYENRHARFTAVDPLLASGKSANPQTFNRYVYVMNNPLVFTDPSGLQAGSRKNSCPIGNDCALPCNGANCSGTIANDGKSITYNNPIGSVVSSMSEWGGEIVESIQSGVDYLFGYAANSDPLQNANYQQFGNFLDATSGSPEALESLDQRFIGNQGPTTFSVLQQTNESYGAARTVSEWGFFAQNVTLGAAGMVGPGSASVTTNKGIPLSGNTLFSNLFPNDTPRPIPIREVYFDGNKWRATGANGTTITPNGRYNFVVQNDSIFIARPQGFNGLGGHVDLSRGNPVQFAGEIRFGHGNNAGNLRFWNNASGHFRPPASSSNQAPLPQNLFRPFSFF